MTSAPTIPGSGNGRLTVFLGYAAGVGKTYAMLEAGQRLRNSGANIVLGYFEPHGRPDTIALTAGFETIPNRLLEYRGARFTEMDTPAILARRPAICLVDELAHANVPGSEHSKRWEDVQALRAAGIHVLTTMNVQHLESLNDQVWSISGVRVRETVPDWVIQGADEVVMVDLTPRALQHRLERGVIYAPEKAEQALRNFFRESTLSALRELTLRQTAHTLDLRQEPAASGAALSTASDAEPASSERLLVYLAPHPSTAMVIRRAKRVADFLRAGCLAVQVQSPAGENCVDAVAAAKHLRFARDLRLETHTLEGRDVAQALVAFARQHHVTQIFLAREAAAHGFLNRIVRLGRDMRITIVADRRRTGTHE